MKALIAKGGYKEVSMAFNFEDGSLWVKGDVFTQSSSGAQALKNEVRITQLKDFAGSGMSSPLHLSVVKENPRQNQYHYVLTQRYYEGGDLAGKLWDTRDPLTELDRKSMAIELLDGLARMHNQWMMVHRDIKPENILIYEKDKRKHGVISDFGMVIERIHQTERTLVPLQGTLIYLSPDAASEALHIDPHDPQQFVSRSDDVWAMGLTFYQLFSRRFNLLKAMDQEIFATFERKGIPKRDSER